jgi:16S rRNA (adenine1518-N6/adenine1519-N6)-dimethyltransferase
LEGGATIRTRRQKLGQHFLRDARIGRAIVEALPASPARVIEIGPGQGALTGLLLERFPRVRAVELDPRLAASLAGRLGGPAGLEVVTADALTVDLDQLTGGERWSVAGNLPYSVGTPIIRRLIERHEVVAAVVVMVQLEVARRLVAGPGDPDRGFLSVLTEMHGGAELLFSVPPSCFNPPPRVTSAVVRMAPRAAAAPPEVVSRALALAADGFSHRRKKLLNALPIAAARGDLAASLPAVGLDAAMRPQEVPVAGWLALARALPGPPEGA